MRQRVVATTRQRNTAFRQWTIATMRPTATPPAITPPHASRMPHGIAPIRRGNSRAAHTHSHIVHAHSRTPYRMGRTHSNMFPYLMSHAHSHMVPHHMGHAYSHTLPYRMGHAHSHILPYRMDQTAHPPGSTGRGYISPCRMDRTNAHVRKCLNGASLQRFGLYMSENARMGPIFPSRLIATTTSELRKPRSKL